MNESDATCYYKILHEFYHKEAASKSVINARSSLPWNTKRTIITQEILRIMLRCSPDLPWETTKSHVEQFMMRLQFSGYDQKFRAEVVRSAFKAHRTIIDKDKRGEQPIYRPKSWRRKERQKERREKKSNWYKKGDNISVIFVPTTPGSELKKRYEKDIKKAGFKIKVVERSGRTLKSMVQKPSHTESKCENSERCMVCREEKSRGLCRRDNINYEIACERCECVYIGESARNAFSRGTEHLAALQKRQKSSVLWRHTTEMHKNDSTQPKYKMTVTSTHRTALDRQIKEAVTINNTPRAMLINNKQEFGHNCLWRASLTAD